jgi:hypothetical protein
MKITFKTIILVAFLASCGKSGNDSAPSTSRLINYLNCGETSLPGQYINNTFDDDSITISPQCVATTVLCEQEIKIHPTSQTEFEMEILTSNNKDGCMETGDYDCDFTELEDGRFLLNCGGTDISIYTKE